MSFSYNRYSVIIHTVKRKKETDMPTNIQNTASAIIATEIMLNIQRGAGRDWDIAYAKSDANPDEDYDDGFGWTEIDKHHSRR